MGHPDRVAPHKRRRLALSSIGSRARVDEASAMPILGEASAMPRRQDDLPSKDNANLKGVRL